MEGRWKNLPERGSDWFTDNVHNFRANDEESEILPVMPVKVMLWGSRAVVKDVTPPNFSSAHFRSSESPSVDEAASVSGDPVFFGRSCIEVPFVTCKLDGKEFCGAEAQNTTCK